MKPFRLVDLKPVGFDPDGTPRYRGTVRAMGSPYHTIDEAMRAGRHIVKMMEREYPFEIVAEVVGVEMEGDLYRPVICTDKVNHVTVPL